MRQFIVVGTLIFKTDLPPGVVGHFSDIVIKPHRRVFKFHPAPPVVLDPNRQMSHSKVAGRIFIGIHQRVPVTVHLRRNPPRGIGEILKHLHAAAVRIEQIGPSVGLLSLEGNRRIRQPVIPLLGQSQGAIRIFHESHGLPALDLELPARGRHPGYNRERRQRIPPPTSIPRQIPHIPVDLSPAAVVVQREAQVHRSAQIQQRHREVERPVARRYRIRCGLQHRFRLHMLRLREIGPRLCAPHPHQPHHCQPQYPPPAIHVRPPPGFHHRHNK